LFAVAGQAAGEGEEREPIVISPHDAQLQAVVVEGNAPSRVSSRIVEIMVSTRLNTWDTKFVWSISFEKSQTSRDWACTKYVACTMAASWVSCTWSQRVESIPPDLRRTNHVNQRFLWIPPMPAVMRAPNLTKIVIDT
jgi:hypothetical protein